MGDYNVISTEWPEGTRLVLLWRFAGCVMNVILRPVRLYGGAPQCVVLRQGAISRYRGILSQEWALEDVCAAHIVIIVFGLICACVAAIFYQILRRLFWPVFCQGQFIMGAAAAGGNIDQPD